jgi:hypothetical protein
MDSDFSKNLLITTIIASFILILIENIGFFTFNISMIIICVIFFLGTYLLVSDKLKIITKKYEPSKEGKTKFKMKLSKKKLDKPQKVRILESSIILMIILITIELYRL